MPDKLVGIVEKYFAAVRDVHRLGAGTEERSFYPALAELLNALGQELKPKVLCLSDLGNTGAGHPDFGLFAANQVQKGEPRPGQAPERGVIEVKSAGDDAWLTADTAQVSKYFGAYRLVIVTNIRDFLIIGEGPDGRAAKLESFRLATDARSFWDVAATPRKSAEHLAARSGNISSGRSPNPSPCASRRTSHGSSPPTPATRLTVSKTEEDCPRWPTSAPRWKKPWASPSRPRGARTSFARRWSRPCSMRLLRLGSFRAADTGCFATFRLAHRRLASHGAFHPHAVRADRQPVAPPAARARRSAELDGGDAQPDRWAEFLKRFNDANAGQFFYEPFLEAFDPELRKRFGVWYTPNEVVTYMVSRVDKALREDLGVADGLASDQVYILDPCCGTGGFLAAVLRKIDASLDAKGFGALKGQIVKQAALTRVFGFEIIPAPFVVAHLQIGLVLQELGATLDTKRERPGVYLTNALTGWDQHVNKPLPFPELEEERGKAEKVKQEAPILVILGNPPYNGFAGMAVTEERALSTAYRTTTRVRRPEGQGLNDLYVRFFRMAERRIAEKTG